MKGKLQQFSVKLLASTLAVIMSIPVNAFAMVGDNSNTYTENTSVMGIQAPEETKEDQVQNSLLKSELSTDESDDYIIEKSAYLSKTTGQIDYIIKIINKTPEKESSDKQTTTFAITQNTDLLDLKVEKVQALDANGNEEEINYTQGTPNAFNSTDNIRSTGITTNKQQNGVVYYLSAKLIDQALKDLEQKSPQLALDFTIASPDNKIYQDRYALEIEKANTTEITIDNEGNIANPEGRLVENQESLHLYKGEYKEEQKGIFQSTPAQIIWTDYINAKDNKEFTYDINLDQGQDTRESQVKIEYYEAQEKGYVLNESFTKTLAFANNLKLSIPEGYIAKVELNTRPKENTKEFAYNGIKIPNPTYTEEKNEAKEEQASDDADPLPNIFSKNDSKLNSSNDSITDQKDQDFSTNSKTDPAENLSATEEKNEAKEEQASDDADSLSNIFSKNDSEVNYSNDSITYQKDQNFSTNSKTDPVENLSAIALNKDAYFDKLKADDKLTTNIEKATNEIEQILEAYNKEEINWDDFKQSVQNIKNDQEIDESQTKDILASLLIGLNEEKYKVANIDINEAAGPETNPAEKEATNKSAGKDLANPTPDELAAKKLAEEGVTIEDFQNYMYELEEKYGLTDEDASRIYGDNAEAIQALVTKTQEEKTSGDVFAVDNQSAFRQSYPYDIDYWSYQHYDPKDNKVKWDIRIETDQVKLEHLNYKSLGLSLYAPENQKLTDYKVTVKDHLGNEISTNSNASKVREGVSTTVSKTYANGTFKLSPTNNLWTFNKSINKSDLPDDLIIHVEATPTDAARFSFYDLGLRLTPDHNYINDMVQKFKDDWAKLVAAMPWIIPYKSGDAAAKKFEDGFNIVDTRLPAYTYGIRDDKYSTRVYSDKSRSVYGQFINNDSQIKWEVSETMRLQDDDRFVSSGNLGDDILAATFTNSNASGVQAYIEVLEPNEDGSFTKIYETTTNNSSTFRNGLSQKKNVLKPGTVINYIFTKPVNDPTVESSITIDFHERFDYGMGTYGGSRTASIRKLSTKELEGTYHLGTQIMPSKLPRQSNKPNNWYYRVDSLFDGNKGSWQNVNNEFASTAMNAGAWRIVENYDMVFCINPDYLPPDGSKFWSTNPIIIKKIALTDHDKLKPYVNSKYANSTSDLFDKYQRLLFYAEELKDTTALNDRELWGMIQVGLLDINGRLEMPRNPYGQFSTVRPDYDNYVKYLKDKISKPLTSEQKSAIDMYLYVNSGFSPTNASNSYQNLITAKVRKPVIFRKTFENSNEASADFKLYNSAGILIKEWTSSKNLEEKLYLAPGDYYIEETNVTDGYGKLNRINFSVIEKETIIDGNRIPLSKGFSGTNDKLVNLGVTIKNSRSLSDHPEKKYMVDGKEYTGNLSSGTYANSEHTKIPEPYNRYFESVFIEKDPNLIPNTNNLAGGNYKQKYLEIDIKNNTNGDNVSIDSNQRLKINAVNKQEAKVEINKKLLAEDGKYYDAPGISFTLENGSKTLKKTTDRYGIATFDNLPLGSQWTLKELPDETGAIAKVATTWSVNVSSTGTVSITRNKAPSDPEDISPASSSDGKITIKNRTNTTNTGNFKIKKVNKDGYPIPQAGFTLYKNKGKENSIIGKETLTNYDGEIYYYNIPYGTYWLKETTVPEGYQKPSEDKIWTEVTVNKDTQGTGGVVVDSESPTNLEGPDNPDPTDSENPGDPTPEPQPDQTHTKNTTVRLTGSTLDTYNVLSNIAITNGSVNISSPSVEIYENRVASAGSLFKNLFTSTAYAADATNSTNEDYSKVKITNDKSSLPNGLNFDNIYTYEIKNFRNPDLTLIKKGVEYDNEGNKIEKRLKGAEFKLQMLIDEEYKFIDKTATSNEKGEVKFTNLASGKYKVMETKLASTDYRKPIGAVKIFEVKDGKIYVDSEGETSKELDNTNNIIINEKLGKSSIKVNKKNKGGEPLEGVRFGLYDKDLVYLEERTTDKYGKLEFNNLSYGQYWIKELSPKAGYILDSNYRLVNIGENYEVPSPSQGMDVSNYLTFDKQKTNIVSTTGDENWVYPNDSEGMIAKINLNIDQSKSVKPGDTFRLSFSGNVDFDGISYLDDDNLDIYDANGKIAVAKIADNRRSVTYTFTEALDNFKLGNIKVSVPLYMNRLQVKNDRNNVPISINVGNRSVTDYINVNYSNYWYEGPDDPVTVRYINSYPYKVNLKDNTFEMIAYVNAGREQTAYKQAYFSFNEPVSDVRIDAYESTPPNNYNLVESYGIDFNRLEGLQPTRFTTNYNRNTGEFGVKFDNDYYNQATYLVRIRGKINSKNVSGFKSKARYYAVNGQYSNGYYSTRQAAFVTWQDYYPATAESNLVPDTKNRNVEITFINNKNNITFTKVSNSELTKSDNNVETKKVLSGATFELRKLGNNNEQYSVVKESVTSDENGKFGWSEIEPGDYEVWETKASKGYITPNKAVATFTVDEGGNIIDISSLEIGNDKPTYPATGGAGTFIGFALIGTAVMLAGIAYFAIFQNDKNRRRSDRYGR